MRAQTACLTRVGFEGAWGVVTESWRVRGGSGDRTEPRQKIVWDEEEGS
jgi:hypothetical protein